MPWHLMGPSQPGPAPAAYPPASFCPCKSHRVCPSAQHLRRSPQLREHSQCFQAIAPRQTLAMCPGSNLSRMKCRGQQCKGLTGLCSFLDETTQTQADCVSPLSCMICYSKENCLSSTCLTWLTCCEDHLCLHADF